MRNLAYPQEHLKQRPILKAEFHRYVEQHHAEWCEEVERNYVGPITRMTQRMSRRVAANESLSGGESVTVGLPPGGTE